MTTRNRRPRSPDAVLVRRAARRIGLQAAVGTASVVALLAVVTVVVLVRSQDAAADTLLADTVARADDVEDPPSGTWLVIRAVDGTEHTPGLPAGLPVDGALDRVAAGGPAELADQTVGGRDFRVRTGPREIPGKGRVAVQAVLDLRTGQAQLASLLRALLIGGVVGLALAGAIGGWLARRAVRPLETALGLQRRFVADAGHELRTPLTLLSTRAQLLRRRLRGGAERAVLHADVDGLVADAERLAAILDDLLLAADPRVDAAPEAVDLAAVAGDVVAAAAPAAAAAGITISGGAGTGEGTVAGSAAGLRRALTALTDNAVRHAASGVGVGVSTTPDAVVVTVTDDGPGIDDGMLSRLFERFASGGDSHGVGPRRYGLGLALVSEIVDRHGGTVTAANAAPGAVFRLEFPRLPAGSIDSKNPPRIRRHAEISTR